MKNFKLILVIFLLISRVSAQSISRKVIATAGGTLSGGGNTLSYTIGETAISTLTNSNVILTQGFQQPEVSLVLMNLKAFIQGYYQGDGLMYPVLFYEGIDPNPGSTNTDTITVSLYLPSATSTAVQTFKGVIQTDGTLTCKFSNSILGHSYYIGLRHRSALETWSAAPVAFSSSVTSYDFSTAITQAYPDPFNTFPQMIEVEAGVWAIYNGDVNQDGTIDASDFNMMEPDVALGAFGYFNTDITGDGPVDGADFNLLEPNVSYNLFVSHP